MQSAKAYFPGLNGLRFFAAFAVIITHVEFTKKILFHGDIYWLNIDYWIEGSAWNSIVIGRIHWLSPFVTQAGYLGVIFFFVLSGYLITYLLLQEKKVSATVSVSHFYMRRILRIWPLYLLVVVLGFFVLPFIPVFDIYSQEVDLFQNYGFNLVCFLTMVPNLALAVVGEGVPNIGHMWSIGVEEQFYLLWPVVMKYARKPVRTILIFLFTVVVIKLALYIAPGVPEPVSRFIGSLKFESMALGGLGACAFFLDKKKWLDIIYHRGIQVLAFLSIPLIILFTPKSLYIGLYLLFSIPFLIIIMNVSGNAKSILKLQNKTFDFLGRISYGLYVYHLMCITLVFHVLDYFITFPTRLLGWHTLLIYIFTIPLTIIVAAFSYRFFEKKFIQKKKKYTLVVSGDDAR